MRKIKSFPRYLKTQARNHRRFLYTVERRNRELVFRKDYLDQREKVLTKGLNVKSVLAPSNFSLINNTEEMIFYVDRLKDFVFVKHRSVIVDLSEVTEITNDALILLLSVGQDPRLPAGVRMYIKYHENTPIAERLRESGIREQFADLEGVTPARYGRIRHQSSLEADTGKANELIAFATKQIYGRKRALRDVQRILSECVDNTTFHASGKSDKKLAEKWWATVFCKTKNKVAYFSVLDNGIGILDSLKVQWVNELKLFRKYKNNVDLLKAVFEGAVLSSTQLTNRGKGLPGIFRARNRKQFTRLIVITNNVYIDFDKKIYRTLPRPFRGTFFYWEVNAT